MIALVTLAEERLARQRKPAVISTKLPARPAPVAEVAPIVRGACSLPDDRSEGAWKRFVLDFRGGDAVMNFVNGAEVARYGQAGVVTPDHNIRIKNKPLVVAAPDDGDLGGFKSAVRDAVAAYGETYKDYFVRNNARVGGIKTMLDPSPRVVLVPGVGLFGLGRSKKDARVAADLAEAAIATITDAEAVGRFEPLPEADLFDVEYWSLEQAKLGGAKELPLAGQVAAITGAAGAIGFATAKAFAAAGAEVALLDVDEAAAQTKAKAIGGAALGLKCDVTDAASVRDVFAQVASAFGGVDIVVSNAGAAWQGRIGEVDEAVLRESFELNFYGHQRVAQAAVKIMRAQGTGGCLLFNVSKQAVNPGPDFGPYGLPKAATLFLVRQYALDYGSEGIRANAVNADRIRSGLLTEEMIASRSKVRGLERRGLYARQSARPRGGGRGCRAGFPGAGAGAQDHRRRHHRRRRQHRGRAAVTNFVGSTPAAPPSAPPPAGATLRAEIFAGLVSSTIAIPLAMAFGMFAFVTLGDEYFAYGAMAGLISAVIAGVVSVMLGDRSTRVYAPRITTTFFLGLLLFSLLHRDGEAGCGPECLGHTAGVLRHRSARRPVAGTVRNAAAGFADQIRAASGDGGVPEHGGGAAVSGAVRQCPGFRSQHPLHPRSRSIG